MTATSERLPDFALLLRELERCGWRARGGGPMGGELHFQTARGLVEAAAIQLESDRGERLLLLDLGGLELGSERDLFSRFLDFSMETRLALGAAERLARAGALLLASAGRLELFRLPEETLVAEAANEREYEDELLPALTSRARARGDDLAALPNPMERARALRGWLSHWSRQIGAAVGSPPEDGQMLLWKLILMLQTARHARGSEMLGGWGLSCERRGDRWSLAYDSLGTHPDLAAAIESFDSTFSSRRFTGDAETHLQWLAALEETSLAERLRAELLMQARIKFEAECAAWLFTDVDREQAGWRREVSGLTPIRRRIAASGWMVAGPLKCDVARFGLTAALRDADRLAQYWRDFDVACRREREAGRSAPSQPDLFFGAPRGVGPGGSLDDGINFVLSEALRVEGAPPEEEFGVAVVMLLKALAWIGRCDWPFFGVDTVDRVFEVER